MKARQINSPIIEELINETSPEELAKIDAEMTNNKQQTAVELLWTSIMQNPFSSFEDGVKAYQQAKAMHKQEMIDFGNDLLAQSDINYIGIPNLAEQYYEQTYGGGEQ